MKATPHTDSFIYDAVLTAIDASNGKLIFRAQQHFHEVPCKTSYWQLGAVGRLRLPTEELGFAFHDYLDPMLRRFPAFDDPDTHRWGWCLGPHRFTVEAGILPGRGGAVVRRDTETLDLELPREFLTFCQHCNLSPATILRGFVADLCSLHNWVSCPREDGYSTNGSDERDVAKDYFRRAYGWVLYPPSPRVPAITTGEQSHG
jgi:hypothetical protein